MSKLELIKYQSLIDVIDWDSDLGKWTLYDSDLEKLVFTANDVCAGCRNNPLNGGNGICNCIFGQAPIS